MAWGNPVRHWDKVISGCLGGKKQRPPSTDLGEQAKAEAWARISTKGGGWRRGTSNVKAMDLEVLMSSEYVVKAWESLWITVICYVMIHDSYMKYNKCIDWPRDVRLADRPFSLQLSCWPLPVCISMDDVAVPTSQRSTASNCFKCTQAHVEATELKKSIRSAPRSSCKWWFDLSNCEALKWTLKHGQSKCNSRCQCESFWQLRSFKENTYDQSCYLLRWFFVFCVGWASAKGDLLRRQAHRSLHYSRHASQPIKSKGAGLWFIRDIVSALEVVDGGFVAPKLKTLEDPMVGKHLVTSETVARQEFVLEFISRMEHQWKLPPKHTKTIQNIPRLIKTAEELLYVVMRWDTTGKAMEG